MKEKIIVQCGIQIEDEYWFTAGNTNGLFKKNLSTGKLSFVGFFPNETKIQFRAYTDVKLIDNKLVFTPCFAKKIAIYNLDQKKFTNIELPDYESGINQYLRSVKYENNIYFVPFSASSFIKYNVTEDCIKKLDNWTQLRNQYLDKDIANLIIETICTDNENIYMFMSNKNCVVILDMNTDQFQVKDLHISSDEKICSVCVLKRTIWIVTNKNRIYKWDYIHDDIVQVVDFAQYLNDLGYAAHYIYATSKYIYLINMCDKDIRVFDNVNKEFYTIDMSKYISDKNSDCISLYYYYDLQAVKNNKIRLFSFCDGKYVTINGNKIEESFDGFYLTEDYMKEYFHDFQDKILYESEVQLLLQQFDVSSLDEIVITLIKNTTKYNNENREKENIGKKIYNTLTKVEM